MELEKTRWLPLKTYRIVEFGWADKKLWKIHEDSGVNQWGLVFEP
jgi:hypothetical protein